MEWSGVEGEQERTDVPDDAEARGDVGGIGDGEYGAHDVISCSQ